MTPGASLGAYSPLAGMAIPQGIDVVGALANLKGFEVGTTNPFTTGLARAVGSQFIQVNSSGVVQGVWFKFGTSNTNWFRIDRAAYELIETKGPLGAAATTQTFSALTGDSDGGYMMTARGKNDNAGTATLSFQINGAAVGLSRIAVNSTGIAVSTDAAADASLVAPVTGGLWQLLMWLPYSHKRLQRFATFLTIETSAVPALANIRWRCIQWNNTADELTSLGIASDVANGIGVNSELSLYRVRV